MEKEYNLTLANVPTVCRTCLGKKHNMKDIFEASADKLLFSAYSIRIPKQDGLSQMICQNCIRRASDAAWFKKLCIQSDQIVKGLMNMFTVDHTYSSCLASAEYRPDSDHDNSEVFIAETEDQEQSSEQREQKTAFLGNIELTAKNTDHEKSSKNGKNEAFLPDKNSCSNEDKQRVIFAEDVANNVNTAKRKMSETGYQEVDVCDDPDLTARAVKRRKFISQPKRKSNRPQGSTEKIGNNERIPENKSADEEIIENSATVDEPAETQESPGEAHVCNGCYEQFTDVELYKKLCGVQRKYKCGCGKIFDKFRDFRSHRLIHYKREGKRKFRCTICLKVYATNHGLFTHMKKCTARKLKEQQSKTNDPEQEHLQSKTIVRACFICDAKFKGLRMLSKHLREVHNGQKRYHCPRCYKNVRSRDNLEAHLKMVHNETLSSSPRRSREDKQSSQNAAAGPEELQKSPMKQIDKTQETEKGNTSNNTIKICPKSITSSKTTTTTPESKKPVMKSPPSEKQQGLIKYQHFRKILPKTPKEPEEETDGSPTNGKENTSNNTIKICPKSITSSKTTIPESKKHVMKYPPSEKQQGPVKYQHFRKILPKTLKEPEKQTDGSPTNGNGKTPHKEDKCTKNMISGAEATKPNQQVRTISAFDKEKRPYECPKCSERFKSFLEWKQHHRRAHASGRGSFTLPATNARCKCSVCGKPAQPSPFACNRCPKRCATSSELREHAAEHEKKAVSEQNMLGCNTDKEPSTQIHQHIIWKNSSTVNGNDRKNNSENPTGQSNRLPEKTTSKNSTKENSSLKEDSYAKGCTKKSAKVRSSVQRKLASKQDSQPGTKTATQVPTKALIGESAVEQNSLKLDFSKNQVYAVRDPVKNQYFLLMCTNANPSGTVLPLNQIPVKSSEDKSTDDNSVDAEANKNSSEAESLSKQITADKKSSEDKSTEDNNSAMTGADKNSAEQEQEPQK